MHAARLAVCNDTSSLAVTFQVRCAMLCLHAAYLWHICYLLQHTGPVQRSMVKWLIQLGCSQDSIAVAQLLWPAGNVRPQLSALHRARLAFAEADNGAALQAVHSLCALPAARAQQGHCAWAVLCHGVVRP